MYIKNINELEKLSELSEKNQVTSIPGCSIVGQISLSDFFKNQRQLTDKMFRESTINMRRKKRFNRKIIDEYLFGPGVQSENRFNAFLRLVDAGIKNNPILFWYALSSAYTDCDHLYHFKKKIRRCFEGYKNKTLNRYRNYLMHNEEKVYLKQLPKQLTIYRAMSIIERDSGKFGISWTLDKDVAQFFTTYRRCSDVIAQVPKIVHELTVDKKLIIACFNGRNESEVIYIHTNQNRAKNKKGSSPAALCMQNTILK